MIVFAFIGIYVMPVIGFLFIVLLLRAIQKIVNKKPYTVEMFWSGLFFSIIVWTLSVLALVNE